MEYQHVQRIYKDPIYVNFRKHYCPNCGNRLAKIRVSRIIDPDSPEAKDFKFHTLDSYMIGKVKFIWTEFQCTACRISFGIDEMKSIEKRRER